MKRTGVLGMLAMLFVLPLSAQNITNTLGPGGRFTIKDLTTTFFTLRQAGGNVGIGTISPVSRLHILSGAASVPPRLQSSGTSGFAAGWDFYQGAVGKGYVGVPDLGASFGSGELLLFGGVGTKVSLWANQSRAVTVATGGNVGIGTATPQAKLHVAAGDILAGPAGEEWIFHTRFQAAGDFLHITDLNGGVPQFQHGLVLTQSGRVGIGTTAPQASLEVRGDVRLGTSGQYRAASGEENLRIVRGTVSAAGIILSGSGFTVVKLGGQVGRYLITFSTPFVASPTVTLTGEYTDRQVHLNTDGVTTSTVTVRIYEGFQPFHFIAIGPR